MSETHSVANLLEAGLRAEGLRQRAIANNVANMRTPGYRSVDVKFRELLAEAMDSSGSLDLDELEPELFEPNATPVKSDGNDVSLEVEVGKMVENSLRHKLYVRLLSKKYSQFELAMSVK